MGTGWFVSAFLVFAAGRLDGHISLTLAFLTALLVGATALGIPLYASARRTGARRPRVEAITWVLLCGLLVLVFFSVTRPDQSAVNAATLDSTHHNDAAFAYWPYSLELVWFVRCVALFAGLAGSASVLINAKPRWPLGLAWRAVAFSGCVGAALTAGLLLFAIGGPLLWRLIPSDVVGVGAAAFLTGSLVGTGLLSTRHLIMEQ